METRQRNSVIAKAIELVGSQELFAQRMGVTQQAVSYWRKKGTVPAEYAVLAEQATDGRISRQKFRPDLYPQDQPPQ